MPERERRRLQLHEPYRTILGHFRHEIGHYYWDRFLLDEASIMAFRKAFGDETQDYAESLKRYYENGPPGGWQESFISSYATAHPWEDWAETWAHYLHMADALETAAAVGVSLRPQGQNEPSLQITDHELTSFEAKIESWFSVTYMLNNLNRGLGLPDSYPFVLSDAVIQKLRFVYDTVERASTK
jgi:hypothetical protein